MTPGVGRSSGSSRSRRVAVVGGGITGLAAAWFLRDSCDVVVFESAPCVGGQIRTETFADVPLDVGADAFLARQPEAEALVRAVGFTDADLVAPATGQVHLWLRDRLIPLPTGTVLGAPSSLGMLARSGVLSPAGLVRAVTEPLLPRRRIVGDRSVADLVGERFGREVVDTLVEPLLGGVYAGSVDHLSAAATMPPVWAAARNHRSLLLGLAGHRRRTAADIRPVFMTLRPGLGALTRRLAEQLGARVRTAAAVTSIRRDGAGWSLDSTVGGVARSEPFDAVVLAVPAAEAARLIGSVDTEVARELAGLRTASVGVVALAYDPPDARGVPEGSGILVPRCEGRLVKAVTISSRKWPHHRDRDGAFLLRASVGRADDPVALELDDATLADRVDAEVRWALGIRAPARERRVVRWLRALPQYDVGHLERVERIHHGLATRAAGLLIGGACLDGVGLAARARDARRLADAAAGVHDGRPASTG